MNWMEMTDQQIMDIAKPIMDNLMQASTDIDHENHVRDFSDKMKEIVHKENFEAQCEDYQEVLGYFTKRELVGIFRRQTDVRIIWRQWYTKSADEHIAMLHLVERDQRIQVVNVFVS